MDTNRRTARYADEYKMDHKHRGEAYIFNHLFEDNQKLKRHGTEKDGADLKKALEDYRFHVNECKDYTLADIKEKLKEASEKNHSDNDCILIAIMSHGNEDSIHSKDGLYKLEDLLTYFTAENCHKSLIGKPKLWFIQACQGENKLESVRIKSDYSTYSGSYAIEIDPDFLIAYSTTPGLESKRDPVNGTWFIQSIVAELKANDKNHDICTLLTLVNRRVAEDYSDLTERTNEEGMIRQIPSFTSSLTSILRFTNTETFYEYTDD